MEDKLMEDLVTDEWLPTTIEWEQQRALLIEKARRRGATRNEILDALGSQITEDGKVIDAYWGQAWLESGFPVLKVSPKWAAAAMTTSVPRDVADKLKAPWEAFILELPRTCGDLLFMYSEKEYQPVSFIKVGYFPTIAEEAGTKGESTGDWMIVVANRSTANVLRSTAVPLSIPDDVAGFAENQPDPPNVLAVKLAGRLIASALCAMQTPKNLQRVGVSKNKTKNERTGVAPTVYQILEPVTVDLTQHVRQYQLGTSGSGKKLELQLVVCGHRKNQPYGPKRSLRKPIWIEPYIRGPETAPMALRAHILKTE